MQCYAQQMKNFNKKSELRFNHSIRLVNPNKDLLTAATFRTIAVKLGLTATLHHRRNTQPE